MNSALSLRTSLSRRILQPQHLGWLIALSAVLPQAAFPPWEWAPVTWIALVPLLVVLERTPRGTWGWFGLGWGWGLAYYAVQFRWLPEALVEKGGLVWSAFTVLTAATLAVSSLYPALAIGLARWSRVSLGLPVWGTFPVLFAAQDALLGVTPLGGQPWATLAATQTETWVAGWVAPTFGGSGLVGLIAAVNAGWAVLAIRLLEADPRGKRGAWLMLAALLVVTVACLWPSPRPEPGAAGMRALIVPGDVSVAAIARSSEAEGVLRSYLAKTLPALPSADGSDEPALVVWPESAIPGEASRGRKLAELFELSSAVQADFLFGSNARVRGQLFNSAYLVTSERFQTNRYDKMRLVPFGEYVPAPFRAGFGKKLTEGVQDYAPGHGPAVLDWRGTKLGVAICFESILPGHTRRAARDGAEVLVVISNDQWLTPAASRQHLRLTALRALETGREALVATNGGWSGHVRQGRLVAESPPGGAALTILFQRLTPLTPWTRWGYLPLGLLSVLWLLIAGAWRWRRL
jgi:apolipoprotein N-acyltransferase